MTARVSHYFSPELELTLFARGVLCHVASDKADDRDEQNDECYDVCWDHFLSVFPCSFSLLYRVPPLIAKPTSDMKKISIVIPWKMFMESLYKL